MNINLRMIEPCPYLWHFCLVGDHLYSKADLRARKSRAVWGTRWWVLWWTPCQAARWWLQEGAASWLARRTRSSPSHDEISQRLDSSPSSAPRCCNEHTSQLFGSSTGNTLVVTRTVSMIKYFISTPQVSTSIVLSVISIIMYGFETAVCYRLNILHLRGHTFLN